MEADSGRFFDDCAARPHALADFVAQRQAELWDATHAWLGIAPPPR